MEDPWDDSALINAFNSAVAKYKTMHGIPLKSKGSCEDVTENIVHMESESQVIAMSNEHGLEQNGQSDKDKNAGEPPHQADKHSFHEDDVTRNSNLKEAHGEYNGYADPSNDTQHHGHSASAENCYLCQWNAYYNQAGAWASPAASFPNGIQCQYCGYVNHCGEAVNIQQTQNQTPQTYQPQQDATAIPDMVKAAVAEALKTADGQNPAGIGLQNLQAHSSFSDVAVAWFLAGFHTSRYLSQSKES